MRYFMLMSALWGVTLARVASAATGLEVETDSPDALCPDLATTRDAIHSRLGTLALDADQRGWTLRYTVGHAPGGTGDFVRLELSDPSGATRLVRDLPREGVSCPTLSQAIALVVERYFRELAPPLQEQATVALSSAAAEPRPAPRTPPEVARKPLHRRFTFGLGGGYASAPSGALLMGQGGVWLWPALELELAVLVPLAARTQHPSGADLELRSYAAELGVGWGDHGPSWDAFVGPEARLTLQVPRVRGLRQVDSSAGGAFSAGLLGGANWWPLDSWGLMARASVDYTLADAHYRIAQSQLGGARNVLEEPSWQAFFSVGLSGGAP
jgi:hypothetical protein